MKKAVAALLSLLLVMAVIPASLAETAITKISIKSKLTLFCDCDGVTLIPTLKPAAADEGVVWSSSDEAVIKVDPLTGYAEAVSKGKAILTCASKSGKVKANCKVTAKIMPATIALSVKKLVLESGTSALLTAKFLPRSADFSDTVWTSSNEKVATVKDGRVTAVSKGKAKIICSSAKNGKKAVCKVTVKESSLTAKVTSVDIYSASIERYSNGSPKSVTFTYWIKSDKAGTARFTQASRQTVALYSKYDFETSEIISLTKGDNVFQRTINVVNFGGTTSNSLVFTAKAQDGGLEYSDSVTLPIKGLVKPE